MPVFSTLSFTHGSRGAVRAEREELMLQTRELRCTTASTSHPFQLQTTNPVPSAYSLSAAIAILSDLGISGIR